jgi:hypothetical protein
MASGGTVADCAAYNGTDNGACGPVVVTVITSAWRGAVAGRLVVVTIVIVVTTILIDHDWFPIADNSGALYNHDGGRGGVITAAVMPGAATMVRIRQGTGTDGKTKKKYGDDMPEFHDDSLRVREERRAEVTITV